MFNNINNFMCEILSTEIQKKIEHKIKFATNDRTFKEYKRSQHFALQFKFMKLKK